MTSCASRFESGSFARGSCASTRARASPFPAAAARASFFACLRSESSDGRAGRSLAADIAPPFTERLYPLEIRLKEGARHRVSDHNRWECFPGRGWEAPCPARYLEVLRGQERVSKPTRRCPTPRAE